VSNGPVARHFGHSGNGVPVLQFEDVSFAYGGAPAVDSVTLHVAPGDFTAIVGPNGSGKSTLLKAVLGLVPRVRGSVTLDGRPVARVRRRVAYVPQREAVDWSFPINAEQVVMMGRFPHIGWVLAPSSRDRQAVAEALERVGMSDLRQRQIGSLSGGQQQRIFLARALVQEASVLLLDEPLTGVDATTQQVIVALMGELRSAGTTILQATHDLETAADVSDLLCFVNRRVLAFGTPDETFNEHTLHVTFGGEVLVLDSGDHAHVHGGGPHGPHRHHAER
jgi:manganese/zinc/iron transport system ATP- binding protein